MASGARGGRTTVSEAHVTGTGVHSGERVRVRLHRCDGPLAFHCGGAVVLADVDNVVDTPRCTVLGRDGARVAMVEHLLAALSVAGFWSGVTIEVEGPELPILDGSASAWGEAVAALGPPPPTPDPFDVLAPIRVVHERSTLEASVGESSLEVRVSFPEPIGLQSWSGRPTSYGDLLAARTFAFRDEIAELHARGLARGAVPGCGVVFSPAGPDTPLHTADEPVRHKALDALGDLALLGRPLGGALTIVRGSHAAHVRFVRHLRTLAASMSDRGESATGLRTPGPA